MNRTEEIWKRISGILARKQELKNKMDQISPVAPLPPNRPVPVLPQEYLDLLSEFFGLDNELDMLLEDYRKELEG